MEPGCARCAPLPAAEQKLCPCRRLAEPGPSPIRGAPDRRSASRLRAQPSPPAASAEEGTEAKENRPPEALANGSDDAKEHAASVLDEHASAGCARQLFRAVQRDDARTVEQLAQLGDISSARNESGQTALELAQAGGKAKVHRAGHLP
eukprot:COSAG04_NODE_16147_length_508_cov_1.633252_1_plen_148_part_10